MARKVVAPSRTAPSSMHLGRWAISSPDEVVPLDQMPSWDYSTELRFVSDVAVDLPAARRACGLAQDAEFSLVTVAECREAYWRSAETVATATQKLRVGVTVPAGVAAQAVRLSRRLVVSSPSAGIEPLAPDRGHIVAGADDSTTVVLEGDGGRFPTHALSFSDVGLPAEAPWHVSLTYDNPEDSFAGSVQLLLNTDHKRIVEMVGPDPDPAATADLQTHLSYDVARQLILRAVRDDRLDSRTDWEDHSVGAVLEAVCARTSRRTAVGCRAAHTQDPHSFETELKGQLGYMP